MEARLDPRFVVIEQSQADTLLAEMIEDMLREILSVPQSPLHQSLLDLLTQFGLERLPGMIAALLNGGRSIDFENWLEAHRATLPRSGHRYCREFAVPQVLADLANSPSAREVLAIVCKLGDGQRQAARTMRRAFRAHPTIAAYSQRGGRFGCDR